MNTRAIVSIALLSFVAGAIWVAGGAAPDPGRQARNACTWNIERNARSGGDIQYIDKPDAAITRGDGIYAATFTFRGKNGFGTQTVSTVDCSVRQVGDGHWVLVALDERVS